MKKILQRLPIPNGIGLIVRTAGSGTRRTSFTRDARTLFEVWKDIQDKIKNKDAPCCLYSEPSLAERVVRDYLTEDIDRIFIDNQELFESTREVIQNIQEDLVIGFNYMAVKNLFLITLK